jgi:hypothetical protein
MNSIRRRSSKDPNITGGGIRRRTNNSHPYKDIVPASSRFDNNNTTNKIQRSFTNISNIELQQQEEEQHTPIHDDDNDDADGDNDISIQDDNDDDDISIQDGDDISIQDGDDDDGGGGSDGDYILTQDKDQDILESEFEEGEIVEERDLRAKYNGDYAPYFPNATIFMLFAWYTKHMISTV